MWFKAAILALAGAASTQAKETAVFVHGLAGWGPGEFLNIEYWREIDEFQRLGFDAHWASVGPVSSNWDRACELFAQIKGTRTDYGAAHSAKYGHERFGPDYTGRGLLPEWSEENRVHLVGHSMGGQTIRMLELLLQEGDADEIAAGATSPLFTKQGNWIKTLTTFSTPHDGSPVADVLQDTGLIQLVKNLILGVASVFGNSALNFLYDFDLDHFGIDGQRVGESFDDYVDRVAKSTIFQLGFKDYAGYDLTAEGALLMQQKGQQTYPGTYYFGYATDRTNPLFVCELFKCGWVRVASPGMSIFLHPFANALGSLSFDSADRKNDGLVTLESAKGPKLAYGGVGVEEYRGTWKPDVWMWEEVRQDHLQVVGLDIIPGQVQNLFRNHARRILAITSSAQLASGDLSGILAEGDVALPVPALAGLIAVACVGLVAGVVGTVQARRSAANSQKFVPSVDVKSRESRVESFNPAFANTA